MTAVDVDLEILDLDAQATLIGEELFVVLPDRSGGRLFLANGVVQTRCFGFQLRDSLERVFVGNLGVRQLCRERGDPIVAFLSVLDQRRDFLVLVREALVGRLERRGFALQLLP